MSSPGLTILQVPKAIYRCSLFHMRHLECIRQGLALLTHVTFSYGVRKTTVCAKLANYLKKQGKSCMLVAGDVYKPVAIDQLAILGKQVDVPVYTTGTDVKPSEIAKQGLEEAKKKKIDVVIVDTAEVLLVVDAMTGQEATCI
ncbi:hypothetical protein JHK82_018197 [Glycine max]|nr:hypothetical protein JHK85_018621 [Glycine max]KAG5142502.1 hypothetical protein JHK82_018197 [Glycine max]